MSLLQSPSLKTIDRALKNISLPENNYVLSLTALDNYYAASASSPSNQIHIFDKSSLRGVKVLSGHDVATSYLRTINTLGMSSRAMLLSSGKDGCVKAWDERTGKTSIEMMTSGRQRPLLCCDASKNGLTVAAGTSLQKEDAFILYWDPRNPAAPLRTHGSTHSDDITAVHFLKDGTSPSSMDVLLSSSSDGLLCTSNPLEDDEDEAILHVGNWGCSVSQGGWIHDMRGTRVWAASDMETFSYWSNELDQTQDMDIRSPSLHHHGHTWVTDYLINCHSTPRTEGGLGVFVGSNEGDVALITSKDLSDASVAWTIHSIWATGHTGVVRSILWDEENDVLVTGGEDSKINAWHMPIAKSSSDTGGVKGDDMELDSYELKRELDDSMEGIETGASGKRLRRS